MSNNFKIVLISLAIFSAVLIYGNIFRKSLSTPIPTVEHIIMPDTIWCTDTLYRYMPSTCYHKSHSCKPDTVCMPERVIDSILADSICNCIGRFEKFCEQDLTGKVSITVIANDAIDSAIVDSIDDALGRFAPVQPPMDTLLLYKSQGRKVYRKDGMFQDYGWANPWPETLFVDKVL